MHNFIFWCAVVVSGNQIHDRMSRYSDFVFLFKKFVLCKPGASMSGPPDIWLQILKTNYNDKIPPFGGLIEFLGL